MLNPEEPEKSWPVHLVPARPHPGKPSSLVVLVGVGELGSAHSAGDRGPASQTLRATNCGGRAWVAVVVRRWRSGRLADWRGGLGGWR